VPSLTILLGSKGAPECNCDQKVKVCARVCVKVVCVPAEGVRGRSHAKNSTFLVRQISILKGKSQQSHVTIFWITIMFLPRDRKFYPALVIRKTNQKIHFFSTFTL